MAGESRAAGFGPYRLEELIRQSAAASVYRATDSRHGGRAVALKLFAPHLSADPAFRERFGRDAGLLSALREPHVVPIHTYGVHDGVVYLDMRLVRGQSLADVQRAGGLDAARAGAVVDQLAAAVVALRSGGLGNRPVTSEDVLLSGSPGSEFVHLVGLGLGRPPVAAPPDVEKLVGAAVPAPRRRRRWWPAAAVVATLALVVAAIVWLRTPAAAPAEVSLPPGQIAALSGGGPAVAAAVTVRGGAPVIVTASGGAIRTWNPTTGELVAPTIEVDAKALATAVLDGAAAVVSRGPDQLIRVHRLADGQELVRPIGTAEPIPPTGDLPQAPREVVVTDVGGRPAVVGQQPTRSGRSRDPDLGFAVWSLPSGEPIVDLASAGQTYRLVPATIDDTAVVLTQVLNDSVQVFDVATGEPTGSPIMPGVQIYWFDVVDHYGRGSGPVVAVGCADNTVRLFDLRTGAPVGPALRGHTNAVSWVSPVRSGGRDLLVSRTRDGETRFWDLDSGSPVGPVLVGTPSGGPLLTTEVDGRGVLVTATDDGAAVWDVGALIEEKTP